jgi:hypothetical protein
MRAYHVTSWPRPKLWGFLDSWRLEDTRWNLGWLWPTIIGWFWLHLSIISSHPLPFPSCYYIFSKTFSTTRGCRVCHWGYTPQEWRQVQETCPMMLRIVL